MQTKRLLWARCTSSACQKRCQTRVVCCPLVLCGCSPVPAGTARHSAPHSPTPSLPGHSLGRKGSPSFWNGSRDLQRTPISQLLQISLLGIGDELTAVRSWGYTGLQTQSALLCHPRTRSELSALCTCSDISEVRVWLCGSTLAMLVAQHVCTRTWETICSLP